MTKLDYALYKGEVFKKNPASMFTFEHACSIREFLSLLANNDHLKDLIVNNFSKVENFLADPECEFSRQLKVNYDLIEVSGGWCFSISERKFIQNGIKEVGKESPRAFVQYLHDKEPDAKFFKEILHNSLSPTDVGHFCEYFLRLLNHGIKPHKEKVLCLIGAPNSGKTSLFTPITRIVPARYIAMITKQKSFNKSLVDENTQVIFMDEAHVGLLDPDDWKILTQGGLTAHDRKYKKSNPAVIRCPMFITCQTELDFGEEHNAAMDARLRKFYFKSLNAPPTAGVQQALHDDAMDCIVWASRVAKTPEDELPAPRPGSVARSNEFNEKEKDRIMSMNLDSESDRELYEEDQLSAEGDVLEEEEEGESSSCGPSSQSGVQGWERSIHKISELRDKEPCHSLKERQLGLIASGVKRATKEIENEALRARERILHETRERWISIGMIRQEDAHLLENVEGPYHPTIERSREEYFAKKKEEEQTILEEKAASYYENEWVWEKEKELRQLQEREEAAKEEEVKRALQYMIGVTTEALKLHFKREELPGLSKLVIGERKTRAMAMKWLSSQQAQLITSVWAPLPFPFDGYESEEEEEAMFITQSTQASSTTTPSQVSHRRSAKKRPAQRSTQLQVSKRERITRFFTPIQK